MYNSFLIVLADFYIAILFECVGNRFLKEKKTFEKINWCPLKLMGQMLLGLVLIILCGGRISYCMFLS